MPAAVLRLLAVGALVGGVVFMHHAMTVSPADSSAIAATQDHREGARAHLEVAPASPLTSPSPQTTAPIPTRRTSYISAWPSWRLRRSCFLVGCSAVGFRSPGSPPQAARTLGTYPPTTPKTVRNRTPAVPLRDAYVGEGSSAPSYPPLRKLRTH